jgi:galactokinase
VAMQSDSSDVATIAAATSLASSASTASLATRAEHVAAGVRDVTGADVASRRVLASMLASPDRIVRVRCQPSELLDPLAIPAGVTFGVIDVGGSAPDDAQALSRLRVATAMGQVILLDKMRQMGRAAGREMVGDPLRGYLANLALNDYRRYFRAYVPEQLKGGQFLLQFGSLSDRSLAVEPDHHYAIQSAVDFHVFGVNRVQNFTDAITRAAQLDAGPDRARELDKAGHLLYAAHAALSTDAGLNTAPTDPLVERVRKAERQGFYGATTYRDHLIALQRADARPLFTSPE